jgi:imidazolonepropionase-like amidohydrolase
MVRHRLFVLAVTLFVPATAGAQAAKSGDRVVKDARPPVRGAPAGVTAFVDVAVIPMDAERVLPGQTVLVKNGWIAALGPIDKVQVPAGAARIDGRGKYLMPGLGDCHVHIHTGRSPAFFEDSANVDRLMIRYLADGVTTVRNMDHAEDTRTTVVRLRDRIAAGEVVGPRIYTSGRWRPGGMNARGSYDPEAIASQIDAYKAAGYDFIKVYSWDNGVMFDSLTAAARRMSLPVAGHIPAGVTVRQALAAGMKSFEHNYGYFQGGGGAKFEPDISTDSLAVLTKNAGAWNCPTYFWWQPERGRINKALQDAGAGLLLGTDVYGDQWSENKYLPRHLTELVRAGLTPYQALATGTRNMAQYFGTLDSAGTVAVGKRADLVLLNGNPLEDVRNTQQPAGVMVGGRWLPREELDRRMTLLDPHWADKRRSYLERGP